MFKKMLDGMKDMWHDVQVGICILRLKIGTELEHVMKIVVNVD